FFKLDTSDILVVHDDLDIGWGEFKLVQGKGPKIHNGILSVEQSLSSKDFWRLRIGADSRTIKERNQIPGREYVLKKLTHDEVDSFTNLCQKAINPVLDVWLRD